MADNLQLNLGSGGSLSAADDVSSVFYTRVKISQGSDGVAQDNWTPFRLSSAATTNATNVKNAPGALGFLFVVNTTATLYYLKLYNKASTPAPASDNALLIAVIPIPASATGAGISIPIPGGAAFTTGIGYALTGGSGDTDNTSAATGVFLFGGYA